MSYYETFIGNLAPQEFINPFLGQDDPIQKAIENVLSNWVWDCPIPEDFQDVIYRYVSNALDM